jgi:predicted transcriptional regulator of viral defense system
MKQKSFPSSTDQKAIETIRRRGGIIRTAEAIRNGIHPRTLYELRDNGQLETLSRGLYRLTDDETLSEPDFVIVASRIPQAVLCLVSALAFHELTTQVPHSVSIALAKGTENPRLDYPPLSVHRFSGPSFTQGVEEHPIDEVKLKVYSPEKTIADSFKFRNKIGMDVVLEALKLYMTRRQIKIDELIKYARICRVEKIIRPYLEASL